MVDLLKLGEKPEIRCRHSGGALGPGSIGVFPDYIEIKALDPGLKPAGVT
jgi:hypothetical protein